MSIKPTAVHSVPIDSLEHDPQNPRHHPQRNVNAIAASLERFGQVTPIVVTTGSDGTLIVLAGNGTLQAARGLGWDTIQIVHAPAHWTYEEARAYSLADNRTAELSEWDTDTLSDHLLELDSVGWDVSELGFQALTPPTESDGWEPDNTRPQTIKIGPFKIRVDGSVFAEWAASLPIGRETNEILARLGLTRGVSPQ